MQPADSIQWYKNNIAIAGANQTHYRVTESGMYHAVLIGSFGCFLKTISQQIIISSIPVTGFSVNASKQCLFTNQFIFYNNSKNAVGEMEYRWLFGDGLEANTRNIIHTYTKAGIYDVKLIVSSNSICFDSFTLKITVYQNPIANFAAPPVCVNVPVQITNNTFDTLGSPISYLWTFANGQTSSLKNPMPHYSTRGKYAISLLVSSAQCPLPGHKLIQKITVEVPRKLLRYPVEFCVINLPLDLQARQFGESVLWKPSNNLNNEKSYNPIFKGLLEQEYIINIKTSAGCVTSDTQMVKLVKDVAVYVPSAFTPTATETMII